MNNGVTTISDSNHILCSAHLADLLKKPHNNVKRSLLVYALRRADVLGEFSNLERWKGVYKAKNNQENKCYKIPKSIFMYFKRWFTKDDWAVIERYWGTIEGKEQPYAATLKVLTMSSLVIAEITGKLHCNVLRDIRNTLRAHRLDPEQFTDKYTTRGNHAEKCYELPRDETWLVVEKYAHRHSDAVMARWDKMEAEWDDSIGIDRDNIVPGDAPNVPAPEAQPEPGLAIFNSSEFGDIRTVTEDGEPLFCAKDVATALGYSDSDQAVRANCTSVQTCPVDFTGQVRHVRFIPESDVYRLVMRSKLPGAERFQDWVVKEVLPTIRKTGRFEVTPAHPQDPTEALRRAVEAIQLAADLWKQQNSAPSQQLQLETQELRAELAKKDEQLEAQKPAVAFHENFHASGELKNIVSTAKAVGIPEKKFVAMCLDFGVLLRDSKDRLEPCVKWMRSPFYYTEYKMGRDALGVERWQPFFTPAGLEWIGGYIEKKKKQTGKYLD